MDKQSLAANIWDAVNKMPSPLDGSECTGFILSLIFYKYLSDNEEQCLNKRDYNSESIIQLSDDNTGISVLMREIQKDLGYYISYKNLFSTWRRKDFNVSFGKLTDAINAFNWHIGDKHREIFSGIFSNLYKSLHKFEELEYSSPGLCKNYLQLIEAVPTDLKNHDVLGYVFEYLIYKFAVNASKNARSFYTPREISILLAEIIANHMKGRLCADIYDPACGSGSLLISIDKTIRREIGMDSCIRYYAQEIREDNYNLTRMNLLVHNNHPYNIHVINADTLAEDWPCIDEAPCATSNPLCVDVVALNPPISSRWSQRKIEPRFSLFGSLPQKNEDYAFVLQGLYHLKTDGIMTIILPQGVLYRGEEEAEIRKKLVNGNYIDTIIGLPPKIFFNTTVPLIVMVIKKTRDDDGILFVDASRFYAKRGKDNILRPQDIKKILDTVVCRKDNRIYSRKVSSDEVRRNKYDLSIYRYVTGTLESENLDIWSLMNEAGISPRESSAFSSEWDAFKRLKAQFLDSLNSDFDISKSGDIEEKIENFPAIEELRKLYRQIFAPFSQLLENELMGKYLTLDIEKSKVLFSNEIFKYFGRTLLLDPYEFYDFFDEWWEEVAKDLAAFRKHGKSAANSFERCKASKMQYDGEIEEQSLWKGKILPLAIVQEVMLPQEKCIIDELSDKLETFSLAYDELLGEALRLLEDLDYEQKPDFINNSKTAFIKDKIDKSLENNSYDPAVIELLNEVQRLNIEEKALKRDYKNKSNALEAMTIQIIKELSDEQVLEILRRKWITPFMKELDKLPNRRLAELIGKLKNQLQQYDDTILYSEQEVNQWKGAHEKHWHI